MFGPSFRFFRRGDDDRNGYPKFLEVRSFGVWAGEDKPKPYKLN